MKKYIPSLLAIIVLLVSCTTEQDFPSKGRQQLSLNEEWEFKLASHSDDWEHVTIPHTWNNIDMQTQRNTFYEGVGLYRKKITADSSLHGKRIFIRFEGVASVTELSINGRFVGNHSGGYSAFAFDITNYLIPGAENELLVKVDNASRPDVIPINHRLFGVYGGIYRPVQLIITNPIHIAVTDYASPGIYLSQKAVSSRSAELEIKVKIDNKSMRSNKLQVRTRIYDMEGSFKQDITNDVTVGAQGRHMVRQTMKVKKPRLWQGLEDPYLYKTIVQLIQNDTIIDEVVQPLGFRHAEFRIGEGMFLNGKHTPMYGVCRHQDWWELGSALENEHHDTDLEIIKELGATTIRLAHYQQSEYFYAKCDSMGFLVWAEIPFVNRVSTHESANAKQQLTELIRQNYNHPSIYVWGLHNEVYHPSGYVISLTEDLHDLAKTEDPYRYTVQVSGYNRIDHEVNNNADIQGINQYFGWYNGTLDSLQTWVNRVEKQFPEHMVIFSEYGTEANIHQQREVVSNRGDCCGFDKDYNESFATRFHEEHWNVISNHPYLLASYIWNTFDFATPMSSQGKVEARNMKGLVTFDRKTKKDPFYWYKANWSTEPVLYITQRRVVNRGNKVTPITVYSNHGVPNLWVNGHQINRVEKGYTEVHYIFPDVELKEGENHVIAEVSNDGELLEDKVVWNYSENFKELDNNAPAVRLNEHVGL